MGHHWEGVRRKIYDNLRRSVEMFAVIHIVINLAFVKCFMPDGGRARCYRYLLHGFEDFSFKTFWEKNLDVNFSLFSMSAVRLEGQRRKFWRENLDVHNSAHLSCDSLNVRCNFMEFPSLPSVNSSNGYFIERQQPMQYVSQRDTTKTEPKVGKKRLECPFRMMDTSRRSQERYLQAFKKANGHWTLHHLSWPFSFVQRKRHKRQNKRNAICKASQNEHRQSSSIGLEFQKKTRINSIRHKNSRRNDQKCFVRLETSFSFQRRAMEMFILRKLVTISDILVSRR